MIRGLDEIKSLEGYNKAKEDLVYCIDEYRWMEEAESSGKSPKELVEEEVKECMKMLNEDLDVHERMALESRIHTLKTKYIDIVNGKYKPKLKRNINGYILMLEHFEAANQNVKFTDLVKGILSGDEEVKDYFRKKYTFTLANMYGTAPAPETLNIESMDDILDYMDKYYNFVDISLADRERKETQLTVVSTEEIGLKAKVFERTNREAETLIHNPKIAEKKEKVNKELKESKPMIRERPMQVQQKSKESDIEIEK